MKTPFLCVLLLALSVAPASGQDHYSLEILAPRDDLPAGHRMTRAYPGVSWSIRVAAVGGEWPYTYALSGQPDGMTIESGPCTTIGLGCTAGTISWPKPVETSSPITVTVCDRDKDCVSETWSVSVSRKDFLFLDAVGGNDAWDGTSPKFVSGTTGPKKTLASTKAADSGTTIWYFMSGTYTLDGMALERGRPVVEFDFNGDRGTGNSTMWIAYPGESPVFDIRYPEANPAPFARFLSPFAYVEGFTCTRDEIKCWEWAPATRNSQGIFRGGAFTKGGPGADGSNAGFIMTSSSGYSHQGNLVVQNVRFGEADHNALKLYSLSKALLEDCEFGPSNGGIAVKAAVSQFTIRSSTFEGCDEGCITGNWDVQRYGTFGEVYHNYSKGSGKGFIYAAESLVSHPIGVLYAYRNTIVDSIRIDSVTSADNDLIFSRNVIVNNTGGEEGCPSKFTCANVKDPKKIVLKENLTGSPRNNIVDAGGNLQGKHLAEHGPDSPAPKGHMLTANAAPGPPRKQP